MQRAAANQQTQARNAEMQYQAASDARTLQFQKQQGILSLYAGQMQADREAEIADKNWGQRTFGW